jgi:hypothetical protein
MYLVAQKNVAGSEAVRGPDATVTGASRDETT